MNNNLEINKYSQNIIINLDGEKWQTEKLKKRIQRTSAESTIKIINLKPHEITKYIENGKLDTETANAFKDIDGNSRIYIIGHGAPKDTFLGGVHFSEMSDFLALGILPEKVNQEKDNLKISLIVCNAGVGDEIPTTKVADSKRIQSCAEKLHEHLGRAHNIKCEVLARKKVVLLHPGTDIVGKKVMHLFLYGVIQGLHQAGTDAIGKKIFTSEESFHSVAGSKVSIKWDENNHQYTIDTYLDKAYHMVQEIITKVENSPLKEDHEVQGVIEKISQRLSNYPQINYEDILFAAFTIKDIQPKIHQKPQYQMLNQRLQSLEKLIKRSISSDSEKFHYLEPQMTGMGGEIPTFSQKIKEEIYDPSLQQLGKIFPKTNELKEKELREKLSIFKNGTPEKENGLRDRYGTVSILKQLGHLTHLKMMAEKDYSREFDISQQMALALEVIGNLTMDKKAKKIALKVLQQEIENSRPPSTVIDKEFMALVEWANYAERHGYLTALTWFRGILGRAKGEQYVIDNLYDQVNDWFVQAMDDDILNISEEYLDELSLTSSLYPKESDFPLL